MFSSQQGVNSMFGKFTFFKVFLGSKFDLFLFTRYAHSSILSLIVKQVTLSEKCLVHVRGSQRESVCVCVCVSVSVSVSVCACVCVCACACVSFQVYWVAPVLGGILAASFYTFLFCPNPELKKRYSHSRSKVPFSSTKYREVQRRLSVDMLGKQTLFTVMDMEAAERKQWEQGKEVEVSGEVLSSV